MWPKIYTVRKLPYVEGFVTNYDVERINKKQLPVFINNGWELLNEEYFIISNLIKKYKSLNTSDKISIIALIVAIISLFTQIIS